MADDEMDMYICPECGWKGSEDELDDDMCPECGSEVDEMAEESFSGGKAFKAILEGRDIAMITEGAVSDWLIETAEKIMKQLGLTSDDSLDMIMDKIMSAKDDLMKKSPKDIIKMLKLTKASVSAECDDKKKNGKKSYS